MKIQSMNSFTNTSNTITNNKNTSFGHKSNFTNLKNFPNNHCACCGHEMIPANNFALAWGRITRPLSTLLEEKRFEYVKNNYPNIYGLLMSFAEHYPNESLDSIVAVSENHYKMMSEVAKTFKNDEEFQKLPNRAKHDPMRNRMMSILRTSSVSMLNAGEVIRNLEPLIPYLYGYQKDIFEEIAELSQRHPNNKISEIVMFPENSERYVRATRSEAEAFAEERNKHLNNANAILMDNRHDVEIVFKRFLRELDTKVSTIYRQNLNHLRISYLLKEAYQDFINEHGLNGIEASVLEEISQVPTQLFSKNSFLAYARGHLNMSGELVSYNDGDIVGFTIKPFMETCTRIIPPSEGGTYDSGNIAILCKQCNEAKSTNNHSISLEKINPEMIENARKQIDFYADKYLSGQLPDTLKYYPLDVAKTYFMYSSGAMNYNLEDYRNALEQRRTSGRRH